jgi:hypothetical protein
MKIEKKQPEVVCAKPDLAILAIAIAQRYCNCHKAEHVPLEGLQPALLLFRPLNLVPISP